MINRSIIGNLKEYKYDEKHRPILVRGARHVGKTTAIREFSREFTNVISLDMESAEDRRIFRKGLRITEILRELLAGKNIQPAKGDTLIYIDEIQNAPLAVKKLPELGRAAKDCHIVAAASLPMNRGTEVSFPSESVRILTMYPLTFREYFEAKAGEKALEILYHPVNVSHNHEKLLELFHEYTIIGGMPGIVSRYLEGARLPELAPAYEAIMQSYYHDVDAYGRTPRNRQIVRRCLSSLCTEAGKRIFFRHFGGSGYPSREAGTALRMLEKAMLIRLIYPTTEYELPAAPDFLKSPILQFLDTGLLNYCAGIQEELIRVTDLTAYRGGIIAGHIVRQELIALYPDHAPLFWIRDKKQAKALIEALVSYKDFLLPVAIRGGAPWRLRSIKQFIDAAPAEWAVRFWAGGINAESQYTPSDKIFTLISLPYYLAGFVDHYLRHFNAQ